MHPTLSFNVRVVDLRHLPKHEREAEALRLAKEEGKKPFDLGHVTFLRALLLRLSDYEHWLFLTLHHIIFDGITIYQVFLSELRTLYEAFSSGQLPSLPELSIQYADFAAWQREWLQGEVLAQQLTYWKRRLAGAPTILGLPTDHPRPQTPSYRQAIYPFPLPKGLTDKLRSLSSREGVTLHMTLLAAFNVLLYRYTRQEDILVGTTTAGRKPSELEKLMGIFINTQVMRTNLAGNPGFRELLQQVKQGTLAAHEHQDVPFQYLVNDLHPHRDLSHNPLF